MIEYIENQLHEKEQETLRRRLNPAQCFHDGQIIIGNRGYHDFASNDYLGLADHELIKEASQAAVKIYGTGARASRLLSGDLLLHHRLEEKIAAFKGTEATLFFNSGYQANVGIIAALYGRDDVVFADKFIHASLIDGIRLSGARLYRYRHNDAAHLNDLLQRYREKGDRALIATESVFSMDGDLAPLKTLVSLKEEHNAMLLVDEAHAVGIYGAHGSGLIEEENLADKVDLAIGTFGKALGSFGAFVAAKKPVIEYLINTARSFIYSTALPPSVLAANLTALEIIKKEPWRRETLRDKSAYLRHRIKEKGLDVYGESQIVPVIVGDNAKALYLCEALKDKGFWVPAIRPPTVPVGKARLRLSLSATHKRDVLDELVDGIAEAIHV